ncbi:MAG: hypothetical protein JW785_01405 [Acidimicrobiia bacterium]|nr:hypothetical protein [Acidimicrobiia bacterium]
MAAADVVRFDASDLMYPPVGTGSSFEAMISYTTTGRLSAARQLAQSGYEE